MRCKSALPISNETIILKMYAHSSIQVIHSRVMDSICLSQVSNILCAALIGNEFSKTKTISPMLFYVVGGNTSLPIERSRKSFATAHRAVTGLASIILVERRLRFRERR